MSLALASLATCPIPNGWHQWAFRGRFLSIQANAVAGEFSRICTIDVEERCFRAGGNVTHGHRIGTAKYAGRSWMAKLHADAIAWLRGG